MAEYTACDPIVDFGNKYIATVAIRNEFEPRKSDVGFAKMRPRHMVSDREDRKVLRTRTFRQTELR